VTFTLAPHPAAPVDLAWSLRVANHAPQTGKVPRFFVWPELPALSSRRPDRPEVLHPPGDTGWVLLQDRRIHWLINPEIPGMGALFWCRDGDRWRLTGAAVPLVQAVLPNGEPLPLTFRLADLSGRAGIVARATVPDGPAAGLEVRAEITIARKAPALAFAISATASSGLDVTFTSLTPAVVTVSGTAVTVVGAGEARIRASQSGKDCSLCC